jgi:NitT/TauT family transport system substrate-binding protein
MNRTAIGLAIAALALAGWGAGQTPQAVRVGLGYFPNVQFAPFYLAAERGLYAAAGLRVEFQHGFVPDLVPLLVTGRLDFVVGDAEDVISARAQGADLIYVLALYARDPNALFALEGAGIRELADLRGRTIGVPGRFGSSYTALQRLLAAAGLTERDVTIAPIGFTQAEAVQAGRVDAAIGFVNNEPLTLRRSGVAVTVLPVDDYYVTLGNGVLTTGAVVERRAALARSFVQVTQAAMLRVIADPEEALDVSAVYVSDLRDPEQRRVQREVLLASIPLYRSAYTDAHGIGASNPAAWTAATGFLERSGRLAVPVDPGLAFTNRFIDPELRPAR